MCLTLLIVKVGAQKIQKQRQRVYLLLLRTRNPGFGVLIWSLKGRKHNSKQCHRLPPSPPSSQPCIIGVILKPKNPPLLLPLRPPPLLFTTSLTCFLLLILGLKHIPYLKVRFNYWQEEAIEGLQQTEGQDLTLESLLGLKLESTNCAGQKEELLLSEYSILEIINGL